MDEQFQSQQQPVFHQINKQENSSFGKVIIFFLILLILGVGSGYVISKAVRKTTVMGATTQNGSIQVVKGAIYGSDDTKTFSDSATGTLQEGGIDGEGQFHLTRPGGDSQNVYLTSSIVDLSQFIGKQIKVNGQTQKAQHAGWLMDVGRVEVLN